MPNPTSAAHTRERLAAHPETKRGRKPDDPRIPAAAKALAIKMGTPKDYRVWLGEARAAVLAADAIDPLRTPPLNPKQQAYLDAIELPDVEWLLSEMDLDQDVLTIKNGRQMTFKGVTAAVYAYLSTRVNG